MKNLTQRLRARCFVTADLIDFLDEAREQEIKLLGEIIHAWHDDNGPVRKGNFLATVARQVLSGEPLAHVPLAPDLVFTSPASAAQTNNPATEPSAPIETLGSRELAYREHLILYINKVIEDPRRTETAAIVFLNGVLEVFESNRSAGTLDELIEAFQNETSYRTGDAGREED